MAAKRPNTTGTMTVLGFSELLDLKPLEFLLPVYPALVCDLCDLVTSEASDPGCGHFYCSVCAPQVRGDVIDDDSVDDGDDNVDHDADNNCDVKCPLDNKVVKPNPPLLDVPWAVASVTNNRIRCPNAPGGCQYIAEPARDKDFCTKARSAMKDLERHYRKCIYLQIPCPSCKLPVGRKEIVGHLQRCLSATGASQKKE